MIAFQIHRADPGINSYCAGLVVLPLNSGARPHLVDISHQLVMDRPAWYGWSAFRIGTPAPITPRWLRSEEHTSELQSLMRISYAVFCLKKKTSKASTISAQSFSQTNTAPHVTKDSSGDQTG